MGGGGGGGWREREGVSTGEGVWGVEVGVGL